jgi:gamma-glutamyl-gamma-aminobutyrate hydrolase PuuD
MNVLIINGNQQYTQLFKSLGHRSTIMGDSIGLAVFTGGADVTPSYYGDTQHPYTGNDEARDEYEAHMFYVCKERNIPMVGICRG